LKSGSKVYYSRALMGCLAGLLCGLLSFSLRESLSFQVIDAISIALAAVIYYVSILLARALGVRAEDLNNPSYLKRGGLFTFILLWLMLWSLTATLLIPPPW